MKSDKEGDEKREGKVEWTLKEGHRRTKRTENHKKKHTRGLKTYECKGWTKVEEA